MSKTIVIGYGSVGRRHAQAVVNEEYDLVIIDQSEDARRDARSTYSDATIVPELSDVSKKEITGETAGIIATWAPTHGQYFHDLVDLEVDRILCEKPMANSLATAQSMYERSEQEDIRLLVNHSFRYSDEVKKIRSWEKEYDLGTPVRFLCAGGALGLINNGVHYMDFAHQIFDSKPADVISTAQSDEINPRSDSLDYFGGTTILDFEDGKEAIFSINNNSSLSNNYRIDYRDAVIFVDDENEVSVQHRDPDELVEYPSITRYGAASEKLYSAPNLTNQSILEQFNRVLKDLYSNTTPASTGRTGKSVLQACIGSLIASVEQKHVSLPISPENDYWEHNWRFN